MKANAKLRPLDFRRATPVGQEHFWSYRVRLTTAVLARGIRVGAPSSWQGKAEEEHHHTGIFDFKAPQEIHMLVTYTPVTSLRAWVSEVALVDEYHQAELRKHFAMGL